MIDRPEIGVSLSHSNGWVAAAVCPDGPVGIDVQTPFQPSGGLIRRCCSQSARSALAALPARTRDLEFAWIWTAQEACVKATGQGLAGRPWNVPVDVAQRHGQWNDVIWQALRDDWPVPISCARAASLQVVKYVFDRVKVASRR